MQSHRDAGSGADAGAADAPVRYPPEFACVGYDDWPPRPTSDTAVFAPILKEAPLSDSRDTAPIVGAEILGCPWDDPRCHAPIFEGTTDADGEARLIVRLGERGVFGVVRITHPGFPVHDYHSSIPLADDDAPLWWLQSDEVVEVLARYLGVAPDTEESATLGGTTYDCLARWAEDVQVSVEGHDGEVFYLEHMFPSEDARTDRTGLWMTYNVAPGEYVVRARLLDGTPVSAARVRAVAGHHAVALLLPTPRGEPIDIP